MAFVTDPALRLGLPGYTYGDNAAPSRPQARHLAWADRPGFALGIASLMIAALVAAIAGGKPAVFLFVGVFVFAVLGLALSRPAAALIVYFAYAAMEGFFKYGTDFNKGVYAVKPLLIVLLFAAWMISRHKAGLRRRFTQPAFLGALALFVGWGLLQVLNPMGGGLVGGLLTLFLWYVSPLAFYLLSTDLFETPDQAQRFCYALAAIGTVVAAFAVFQYAMGEGWTMAHVPGYDNTLRRAWFNQDQFGTVTATSWRPASTGPSSGAGAGWAALAVLASVTLMLARGVSTVRKAILIPCLLIGTLGILVSGVRLVAVITLLQIVLLLPLSARAPRDAARIAVLLLVGIISTSLAITAAQSLSGGILFQRYADTFKNPVGRFVRDRGGNFAFFPEFIAEHPLGIGFQRGLAGGNEIETQIAAKGTNRETQFNSLASDMGLPGVLLLFGVVIALLARCGRTLLRVRDPDLRPVAAFCWVVLAGYFIATFGGPVFQGGDLFWLCAALLLALPRIADKARFSATTEGIPSPIRSRHEGPRAL